MEACVHLLGGDKAPEAPDTVQNGALDRLKCQLGMAATFQAAGCPVSPETSLPSALMSRQWVGGWPAAQINLGGRFPPSTLSASIDDQHHSAVFCGQFNGDGTVFATACQDASIRLYETDRLLYLMQVEDERQQLEMDEEGARRGRKPPCPIRPYKIIDARDVGWSIIDAYFSRGGDKVAYTSWSRYIHLASVGADAEQHESFEVCRPRRGEWESHFCLFSIRFSETADLVAGGANDHHIYTYNLEKKTVVNRIRAHADDVNAICFADPSSSNVLLSGSDDCLILLWDLRSPNRPQGLLMGHAGGITSIASKNNGFNLVSNSKDQTMKLWDLRVMAEPTKELVEAATVLDQPDYRSAHLRSRRPSRVPRSRDLSLRTFHGHQVTRTLIRCCFSPESTTGGRFACTGSSDGRILAFDLLGDDDTTELELDFHAGPVRDLAFHPTLPLLISSSWDRHLGLWRFGQPLSM